MWGKKKSKSHSQVHWVKKTVELVNRISLRISIYLSYKTAHWSKRKTILYFLSGGILLFLFNGWLIINGVTGFTSLQSSTTPSYVPAYPPDTSVRLTRKIHIHLNATSFKHYLDSLYRDSTRFDSLLQVSPGLKDSIQLINKFYNSNK